MPYIDYGSFLNRKTDFGGADYGYQYRNNLDLRPGSKLHDNILDKIKRKAHASHLVVSKRYASWNAIDWTLTTYIQLSDLEKERKAKDTRNPASIVFPYSYAIMETLLGYLVAAFFQDPLFRYEGVSPEDTIGAILLEKVIDLHCNKSKVALNLHTLFRDNLAYGFGIGAPIWTVKKGFKVTKSDGFWGLFSGPRKVAKEVTIFEGNELINIDPYLTLPDPDFSIHDVQKGEFFGWLDRSNIMDMLSDESNSDGDLFNVRYLNKLQGKRSVLFADDRSERERRVGGSPQASVDYSDSKRVDNINMMIKIIPREWGVGEGELPEKWIFSISADEVLTQARPIGLNHNMFPVIVSASDFDGYSSTPVSRIEILSGMQGILDWLFNTHISNVKKSLNDMLIYDPYQVNAKDIEDAKEGKLIRLRRPAWGKGVKDVVQQLVVNDVTKGHIQDSSWIVSFMQKVGAVDDAAMGQLRQGGPERLTGAEFQGTRQGAFSRLERMARVIGLQAMQDIGYMFASHTQQLMSEELFVTTSGRWKDTLIAEFGQVPRERMKVSPFDILVDYDVKVRDGTVPGSNNSAEAMGKMFEIMANNPLLAQKFDMVRIFKYIAENSGVKNVEDFEVQKQLPGVNYMGDEQVQEEVQKGNIISTDQAIQEGMI